MSVSQLCHSTNLLAPSAEIGAKELVPALLRLMEYTYLL